MFKSRERKSQGFKSRDSALVEDLILSCTGNGVSSETAQKAVRALCRCFGGQMIYITDRKESVAEKLRRVIADATNENDAAIITTRIQGLCRNTQLYIPLERCAFRKIIALEIYSRLGRDITINDLAREYNISFTHAYKLWKEGKHEKFKATRKNNLTYIKYHAK